MKNLIMMCGMLLAACPLPPVGAQQGKILYQNDLQKEPMDQAPADFLVLEGAFSVKEDRGNKFLELPGAPLDTFGLLFGPAERTNVMVSARIHATAKGRRFPTFAVGLGGVGGFKLQASPAKKSLELFQGEKVRSTMPFDWTSDQWTWLKLRVRAATPGSWRIEGKAWAEGGTEPESWALALEETEEPINGKSGIWGSPFSGTPIRFDDLKVEAVGDAK